MSDSVEQFRERMRITTQTRIKQQQQQKEEKEQSEYKTEKAAKHGTKAGKTHTNVQDAEIKLVQFLKDTNQINTTQAKNIKKIQETHNKQTQKTITKLSKDPSKYVIVDTETGNTRKVTGNDIDQLRNTLAQGQKNLVKITDAINKGETNKTTFKQAIKQLEEESIKPHLKKVYKYKSQAQKYIKEHTTTKPKEPKTTLQRRSEAQKDFISDLIKADIKDPKKAQKLIKEISPIYAQTVDLNPSAADKFVKELDFKIRNYEKMADYQTPLGIDELTGSNKKQNINKLKARFAHQNLATNKYLIAEAPVMALGAAAGPAGVGFIAAISTATMLNPVNRAKMDEYIRAHPQEFLPAIYGSILAGVSVSAAKGIYNQYKMDFTLAQRKKFDKMFNDPTLLEYKQPHGKNPPTTIPEPDGPKIILSDPVNPEQVIFENMIYASMNERDAAHLIEFISKSKTTFYYDGGGGRFDLLTVEKMLNKHPELKEPYFNPAFKDPNILGKADLVARSNKPGVNFTPLLGAALLQLSKQGYITKDQIEELIKTNKLNITALKREGIEIPSDFTEATLKDLSLPAIAEILKVKQEQLQELTPLQLQALMDTVPLPDIPENPEPLKQTQPLVLSKNDMKKRREMNMRFYTGPKGLYRVTYTYSKTQRETLRVEARSLLEATTKAQRAKTPSRKHWIMIDIEKIK